MLMVERRSPEAFEALYDRHGGIAYSLAYRMLGDRGAAEDVTQEAFLAIWRTRARFDATRGSVRSWLLGVVRNRAIDVLRRRPLAPPKSLFDESDVLEAEPAEESTELEAARRDDARQVRQAVATLPHEQAQVIQLAYFGGFSHSEIAETLQMPIGTVKGRIRLAMEKIRAQLAEGWM